MKRKIYVITGNRAEYGSFYPVLNTIHNSCDLQLFQKQINY